MGPLCAEPHGDRGQRRPASSCTEPRRRDVARGLRGNGVTTASRDRSPGRPGHKTAVFQRELLLVCAWVPEPVPAGGARNITQTRCCVSSGAALSHAHGDLADRSRERGSTWGITSFSNAGTGCRAMRVCGPSRQSCAASSRAPACTTLTEMWGSSCMHPP